MMRNAQWLQENTVRKFTGRVEIGFKIKKFLSRSHMQRTSTIGSEYY
jgi:hypothetical protein